MGNCKDCVECGEEVCTICGHKMKNHMKPCVQLSVPINPPIYPPIQPPITTQPLPCTISTSWPCEECRKSTSGRCPKHMSFSVTQPIYTLTNYHTTCGSGCNHDR